MSRLDRTCSGNRKQACLSTAEYHVACPVLAAVDGKFVRHHFQILDPPVPGVVPHAFQDSGGLAHPLMVPAAVPSDKPLTSLPWWKRNPRSPGKPSSRSSAFDKSVDRPATCPTMQRGPSPLTQRPDHPGRLLRCAGRPAPSASAMRQPAGSAMGGSAAVCSKPEAAPSNAGCPEGCRMTEIQKQSPCNLLRCAARSLAA